MNGQAAKTITLHIRGMFCAHCEETVRKALEPAPGVLSVDVSCREKSGVFPYSCWMGMIQATIEVTDE